jgi:hypothetical protein
MSSSIRLAIPVIAVLADGELTPWLAQCGLTRAGLV